MRAVVITRPGDPDVLRVESVPDPASGEGEVVVKVATSGVNRADLLQRQGRYPPPSGVLQNVPGLEYAGRVETVGPGATRWREGDPVMGIVGGGGYAERVVVDASLPVAVPDGMDPAAAGAIPEVFMTAFDALFLQAELEQGETVLVHAVGSGVGTAALQLALRAGCPVIGTSRTPEKLARAASLGLGAAVTTAEDDWPDRVLDETAGRGVDVILDLVGAAHLAGNQRVLANLGRHVVVGVPGGSRAEIDLRALMAKRARLFGTVLRARSTIEKAALARAFEEHVSPGFADGSLRPVIDRVLPASDAAEAHRALERNETFGKILLSWE